MSSIHHPFFQRGFSLIEILIVIGVLSLLAVIGIRTISNFKNVAHLNASVENGISFLVEARSKTLSSQDGNRHGVHFESGKIVFFVGTAYSSSDPKNKEAIFSSVIEISNISLNGNGADVVFKKLTGDTDQYGTVTFRIKEQILQTQIISITAMGISAVQ